MNLSSIQPKILICFIFAGLVLLASALPLSRGTPTTESPCDAPCHKDRLLAVSRNKGIVYALEQLQLKNKEPVVKENCHYIVHSIGWEAYEQQKTISAALDMGKLFLTFCEAGFTHGVLEHALLDTEGSPLSVADVCDRFPSAEDKFLRRHCFHAIGHALLAQNYELLSALE